MKKLLIALPIILGAAGTQLSFAGNQQQVTNQLQSQIKQVQSTTMAAVKANHDSLTKSIQANDATNKAAIDDLKKEIAQLQAQQQQKIADLQANVQKELQQINNK